MKRKLLMLTLAAGLAMGLPSAGVAQPREGRDSIEWPDERGEFPTLQSAIDALRDGGTLLIREGRFELREPLIVRGLINIEGAGCAELPRGKSRNERATHLAGPPPERVVPFGEVRGLLTYIAGAGGVTATGADTSAAAAVTGGSIKGLMLTGFDAGIRIMASDAIMGGDGAEAGRSVVTIEDSCIAHTGRGIASSAPAAKLVVENSLIRDVLGNAISVSPNVLGNGLETILKTFGVTMLNPGQACVVVKNAVYTGFHDSLVNCGYNGGPGLGGGVLAFNAGVNFFESAVINPNGPGIAANRSTTLIQDSTVLLATGFGILLFEPLYGSIKELLVAGTLPFPPGHVSAGNYGDGLAAAGQGTVWVGDSLIENSARAGIGNFGSFVDLGNTKLQCNGIDLNGESWPTPADGFQFHNRGGNACGCPQATGACVAQSSSFPPPEPIGVNE